MYSLCLARNLARFKQVDLQARCYSLYTASRFNNSSLLLHTTNQRQSDSLRPVSATDNIVKSFTVHQRYLSLTSSRLQEAVVNARVLNHLEAASVEGEAAGVNVIGADTGNVLNSVETASSESSSTASLLSAVPEAGSAVADTSSNELILDFIPEKPVPLDPTTLLGEPSFEALGLGSWWPTGRVQIFMEYLHLDIGLEWCPTIFLTALCMRCLTFPFVVMAQKNVVHMNNNMPGMTALQEKMTEARKRGDMLESAQLGQQLQVYMKKQGINPIKNVLPIMIQVPIFMTMFLGLRGMANLPVPSMQTGGILWFENLSLADPFYLLPFLTSCSLYLQFRIGADGNRLDSMGPVARIVMTCVPFILMPISLNFPSALTFYWLSTNAISIFQAALLRVPAIRKQLGIPKMEKFNKSGSAKKSKGFRASVRETIDNFRVQADIADRRAMDEQMFRDAGLAKPLKTYSYDPSKPVAVRVKPKNKY